MDSVAQGMLVKLYDYRKQAWDIRSPEDLELLCRHSEREFYFYLTYAYLSDMDMSSILNQDSLILRLGIGLYAQQAKAQGHAEIVEYLNKFMITDESTEQAKKVLHELEIAKERERQYELLD